MLRSRHALVLVETPPRPSASIDLGDTARRLAATFVLAEAGWVHAGSPGSADVHVTDRIDAAPTGAPATVLVIPFEPLACRRAVDAFSAGLVHAVVDAAAPEQLAVALDLLHRGVGTVPARMLTAARTFPTLRPRLEHTLQLVLRGHSNRSIARAVQESEATAKRDIAELLRMFDAPNRLALAAVVARLGYRPEPVDPAPDGG